MTNFSFGQPDGGIAQIAYKVDDLESAMADFGKRLGVGPWFVLGPFTPPDALYLSQECGQYQADTTCVASLGPFGCDWRFDGLC